MNISTCKRCRSACQLLLVLLLKRKPDLSFRIVINPNVTALWKDERSSIFHLGHVGRLSRHVTHAPRVFFGRFSTFRFKGAMMSVVCGLLAIAGNRDVVVRKCLMDICVNKMGQFLRKNSIELL